MKMLASLTVLFVLGGCAVDGSDREPAEQQEESTQDTEGQPADETATPPPAVVDVGLAPRVLKSRHD